MEIIVWAGVANCLSGWPRSGWPQEGHFDQKIKINLIASYCAMLYPRCCSLWPCTFWGLHSSDFDSSEGQTRGSHFNFYWGTDTTMWSNVHFSCFCVTKIDFYHQLWNWQVKKTYKTAQNYKKCGFFVFENKFEHLTNNTQFRLTQIIRNVAFLYLKISLNIWQTIHSLGWPRSGWPLLSTLCYKFVRDVNCHRDVSLLFHVMASNMKK